MTGRRPALRGPADLIAAGLAPPDRLPVLRAVAARFAVAASQLRGRAEC